MANSRRSSRERGKSDRIDAVSVARAALADGIQTLPTADLAGPELDIRLLVDHRERLVRTRCALNNTPFEMNADRSALVDPSISVWNGWLLENAADFAVELLTERWLYGFESHGYLALRGAGQLADRLAVRLRTAKCWPARGHVDGSILREARALMPGVSPELDSLLPDTRRLDARLQDPEVIAMAIDSGAKRFTIGSAVRFRCAGKDAKHLSTKLGDDAALRLSGFPAELHRLERQIAFANVFDRHQRQLTTAHRADLRDTATTLTAANTLGAPSEPLWVVDPALAHVSPVPAERRLHPELVAFRSVRSLCEPFDMSAWVRETAERVAEGTATEDERSAVYEQVLRAPEQIRRPSWAAVKASPVVRGPPRRVGGAARSGAALPGSKRARAGTALPERRAVEKFCQAAVT